MEENRYRIGELAEKAEVTKRTIHYYLSRGLLPSSRGAGVGTYYSDEHLYRILLIKRYQENYLPLDEIKRKIMRLSLDEIKEQIENGINESNFIISEAPTTYETGSIYKRLDLGYGVELHYNVENAKAEELALRLYEISKKFDREG